MSNIRSRWAAGYGRTPKALLRDPAISCHAVRVYGIMDDSNGYDTLSIKTIAEWIGASYSTAQRAIYELRDAGWIEVVEREDDLKSRLPNEYIVNEVPFSQSPIQGDPPCSPVTRGPSHPRPSYKELDEVPRTTTTTSVGEEVEVPNAREANPIDLVNHHGQIITTIDGRPRTMPDRPPRSWNPDPNVIARAESTPGRILNVDMNIDRYLIRCRERKTEPSNTEWLRWFLDDEQKAQTEERRATTTTKVKAKWWDCDTY